MDDQLTLVITAIPLFTIAGTALAYVVRLYLEARDRQHQRFFELLKYLDGDAPLATKMGAVYQLREFKEHGEFVERFCRTVRNEVTGAAAQSLIDELDRTADAVASKIK
jgi:hypothetical protein